jgi:hypothetical protein
MGSSCEQSNKPSCSIKVLEFTDLLSDFAPSSYLREGLVNVKIVTQLLLLSYTITEIKVFFELCLFFQSCQIASGPTYRGPC